MPEGSLFGETEPLRFEVPLAERMRPASLDEYAGQSHILGRGRALRLMLEGGKVPSCILYGPPGVGKTTLVRLMAKVTGRELLEINAVSAKVETLRDLLDEAAASKAATGRSAIAFVDEIYHFNKKQQNVLLPSVEAGGLILVGTTTENPWFEINKTLLSRMVVYTLEPLRTEDICALLERALADKERGLGRLGVTADRKLLERIAALAGGDARQALTRLEASVSAAAMGGGSVLTEEIIAQSTGRAIQRYDRDSNDHYAVISALIKSIRGSDPDAALYWLARMLEAGDDLRFITRRLCILASEDVGLADACHSAERRRGGRPRRNARGLHHTRRSGHILGRRAEKQQRLPCDCRGAEKRARGQPPRSAEPPAQRRRRLRLPARQPRALDAAGISPRSAPLLLSRQARRGTAHRRALQTPLEKILVGGRNGEKIVKPPPPAIKYKNAAAYIPRRRFA